MSSFLELSQILTGFKHLDAKVADVYHKELQKTIGSPLDKLLDAFDTHVKQQVGDPEALVGKNLWTDPTFKSVCQSVILIWYNANIVVNGTTVWVAPTEVYYESLLWKVIEAHPPALSGGYFGYWRYAPEN